MNRKYSTPEEAAAARKEQRKKYKEQEKQKRFQNRMKKIRTLLSQAYEAGCDTNTSIAEYLGVTRQTIANWWKLLEDDYD